MIDSLVATLMIVGIKWKFDRIGSNMYEKDEREY